MKKTIKMVVLVDGHEIIVGQCHPGQARILRKNGMAEWDKDKLVLKQAITYDSYIASMLARGEREGMVRAKVAYHFGWEAHEPETFVRSILPHQLPGADLDEIDPDGALRSAGLPYPEERDSEDLRSWILELRARKALGHTVYCCDNPKSLKIGFIDHEDNLYFTLGLRKVKGVTDEELTELGMDRMALSSAEKREEFIGGWDFVKMEAIEGVEVPEGVTLESIWTEEILEKNAKQGELSRTQEFCLVDGLLAVREDLSWMTDEEVASLQALTQPGIDQAPEPSRVESGNADRENPR